jgi:EAL domain-containing protein (putative c-di-GMP-specific phosphodiesterase class I)
VTDNYQNNGFRIAVNVNSIQQAIELTRHRHVDAVKLDSSFCTDHSALSNLTAIARENNTNIIIKRLEDEAQYQAIEQVISAAKQEVYVQGFLFGKPNSSLFSLPLKRVAKVGCKTCS